MLAGEGHYTHEDGYWWVPGDATVYGPAATFYRATAELAPGAGQETIEFDAVPRAFSKEPFMLTMETEKSKITGLKVEPCAVSAGFVRRLSRRRAGVRSMG